MQQATILVVDDDGETRDIPREPLETFGYRTVVAASAEAALALLDGTAPDLILADVHMDGISGEMQQRGPAASWRLELIRAPSGPSGTRTRPASTVISPWRVPDGPPPPPQRGRARPAKEAEDAPRADRG